MCILACPPARIPAKGVDGGEEENGYGAGYGAGYGFVSPEPLAIGMPNRENEYVDLRGYGRIMKLYFEVQNSSVSHDADLSNLVSPARH